MFAATCLLLCHVVAFKQSTVLFPIYNYAYIVNLVQHALTILSLIIVTLPLNQVKFDVFHRIEQNRL